MRSALNLLRNLRMPGRRPLRARGGAPRRPQPSRFGLARAERPRPKRHVPWRRIGLTVVAAAALAGTSYGALWLVTGDTLRVRQIEVLGSQVVNAYDIAERSGLGGRSMLLLDAQSADRAIEAIPAVKSATVALVWPHGVRIEVEEHQAWGYWQAAQQRVVVDADGKVLAASRPPAKDAPTIIELAAPKDLQDGVVTDPDTVRLVSRLIADGSLRSLAVSPSAFLFRRDRGLTVVVDDGPDAVFGDSNDYEFKVQTWIQLTNRLRAEDRLVSEIDLRFGRNVVLR